MNYQEIIIYDFEELYDILVEISEVLKIDFVHIKKKNFSLKSILSNESNFIISKYKIVDHTNHLQLKNFPFEIDKLVQQININFLKKKFNQNSKVVIGAYLLDVNSRIISNKKLNLKLTEKEIEIITFLKNKKQKISIKQMQQSVWGYNKNLETHTVETHIHRLKKKFKEIFDDNNFLKSAKDGYYIN